MSSLTLPQAREALARAEARVQAGRPGDLELALIVRKRYQRRVALLEAPELVTCVVCGGQHGAGHGCMWCACREAAAA